MEEKQSFDLYLDDSGTRHRDKKPDVSRQDGMDCFALGDFIIPSEEIREVHGEYDKFTHKYEIDYPLRSNEIRGEKGKFSWLKYDKHKEQQFHDDLASFLIALPVHVTGCVIHRPGYNKRYAERYGASEWDYSKSAYTIVVERAAKFAQKHGKRLKTYVEETGKKEDRAIRRYHRDLRESGMYFDPGTSEKYVPLGSTDFRDVIYADPNFIKEENPLAQIADLYLYPIAKGRYDSSYHACGILRDNEKLIDSVLDSSEVEQVGIKYFCFDGI
jgi:hypothetical protein